MIRDSSSGAKIQLVIPANCTQKEVGHPLIRHKMTLLTLHVLADQPIVTCVRCGEKTCFNHNVVYHEGQTCKQYERSRPIKDALNRSVSRAVIWWRTRNCPGCFQPIQKHGGVSLTIPSSASHANDYFLQCRHMSCRCGYSLYVWLSFTISISR